MNRKEITKSFLRLAASGKVKEAYDMYIHPNFRHHNPYFRGDALSLKSGMEGASAQFPNTSFEVLRVLEDGDLVAAHSRIRLNPNMPEMAVVHIARFEGDRIAEFWDIVQEAPKDSPNECGMF
ncbi:MAG: nuclear transport factor 2 family protein [Candidatus Zixiibacteriota bacterium]